LEEEVLDRTMWETHFRGSDGPVIKHYGMRMIDRSP